VLVRKFVLFCFVVFATLVNENLKKTRIVGKEEQVSTKLAYGMGSVMSEGGLEAWKMQNHMQVNIENGSLAQCNVNEEQVQVISVEIGETFTIDLAMIEVDMQKIIEIIAEQENMLLL
jgi:hypothetical protein